MNVGTPYASNDINWSFDFCYLLFDFITMTTIKKKDENSWYYKIYIIPSY